MLDRSGHLDLPARLDGVDVVLIADHRFPGPDGPLDPAVVARWLRDGTVEARSVVEMLVGALIEAVGRSPLPAVIAHPLSILPKLGLGAVTGPRRVAPRARGPLSEHGHRGRGQREVGLPDPRHRAPVPRRGGPARRGIGRP